MQDRGVLVMQLDAGAVVLAWLASGVTMHVEETRVVWVYRGRVVRKVPITWRA